MGTGEFFGFVWIAGIFVVAFVALVAGHANAPDSPYDFFETGGALICLLWPVGVVAVIAFFALAVMPNKAAAVIGGQIRHRKLSKEVPTEEHLLRSSDRE
jgi:hypothetical protein